MEHIAGWTNAKKKSESMQTSLLMGDAMSNSGFVSQGKVIHQRSIQKRYSKKVTLGIKPA